MEYKEFILNNPDGTTEKHEFNRITGDIRVTKRRDNITYVFEYHAKKGRVVGTKIDFNVDPKGYICGGIEAEGIFFKIGEHGHPERSILRPVISRLEKEMDKNHARVEYSR